MLSALSSTALTTWAWSPVAAGAPPGSWGEYGRPSAGGQTLLLRWQLPLAPPGPRAAHKLGQTTLPQEHRNWGETQRDPGGRELQGHRTLHVPWALGAPGPADKKVGAGLTSMRLRQAPPDELQEFEGCCE